MSARPRQPYLVCATQRSGSTLLCETLRATGVAGRPLEHFQVKRDTGRPPQPREYFDGVNDAEVLARLAPTPAPDPPDEPSEAWWAGVLERGLDRQRGVGREADVGPDRRPDLALPRDPGPSRRDLRDGFDELLGDTHMVFVTAADRVAQAVSLWKAVQTQEWREDGQAPTTDASSTRSPASTTWPAG